MFDGRRVECGEVIEVDDDQAVDALNGGRAEPADRKTADRFELRERTTWTAAPAGKAPAERRANWSLGRTYSTCTHDVPCVHPAGSSQRGTGDADRVAFIAP